MENGSLDGMVERFRKAGWEPRQLGHNAWESRCPGRSSVEHALHFGRDRNGKLVMQCQSPENCTFTANLNTLILRHSNRDTPPAAMVQPHAPDTQRSLTQSAEPTVSEPPAVSLPEAMTLPENARRRPRKLASRQPRLRPQQMSSESTQLDGA